MMATTKPTSTPTNIDIAGALRRGAAQFRELNPKEPGQWPLLPKIISCIAVTIVVVVVGWVALLSDADKSLESARAKEPRLKEDYRQKLAQAVNLDELKKQKEQVQEYVTQLEKQLPGKAEMDALLSDINQAGIGRGLQFELFRPGQVSRIVTLHNITIAPPPKDSSGGLVMEATARTYRYLDAAEVAEVKRAAAAAKSKEKGKKS
jgi:type IV pilus assembly protein PilO